MIFYVFTSQQLPNEKSFISMTTIFRGWKFYSFNPQTGHFRSNKMVVTIMISIIMNEGGFFVVVVKKEEA